VNTFRDKNKNIMVFTNSSHSAVLVHEYLARRQSEKADLIHEHTNVVDVRAIEHKWSRETDRLLLVCEEGSSKFLEIENVQCVIHFDFPVSKGSFAHRLWFMRRNFIRQPHERAEVQRDTASTAETIPKSDTGPDSQAEQGLEEDDGQSISLNVRNEIFLSDNDDERIFSIVLFTKEDKVYSEGFVNYLSRIGISHKYLPESLLKMAHKIKAKDEAYKKDLAVCPYVKSFGKCFNEIPSSCPYRHSFYPDKDAPCLLDDQLRLPDEGYVKVSGLRLGTALHLVLG